MFRSVAEDNVSRVAVCERNIVHYRTSIERFKTICIRVGKVQSDGCVGRSALSCPSNVMWNGMKQESHVYRAQEFAIKSQLFGECAMYTHVRANGSTIAIFYLFCHCLLFLFKFVTLDINVRRIQFVVKLGRKKFILHLTSKRRNRKLREQPRRVRGTKRR